ncbi:Uncharacterised protein [Serratia quinivorans]|uniref:Uncharacterized protein n=1 Tax=Serratia proteamaculans TaxID=28151 RepID=A0ABS0TYG3_SERPR|nr:MULTISPECIES: hypothetical protein [Serratia]MBI6183414.1 hypothetical protein [Serratia proteamaculans]CAI1513286.1 Uncharacterised protein [Serratia quinivorans]
MKKPPEDYFLDADDELVDFLEAQGEACIKELHQSNMINKENGYKLLSILIVGIGSSFLLLTQKEHQTFLDAGLAVFTVYWSLCAVYLVLNVLAVKQRGLITASPFVLYSEKFKNIDAADFEYFKTNGFCGGCNRLPVIRRYRLETLSTTADEMSEHNGKISLQLTRVRIATILTPACAIFVSVITYFFS